MNKTSILTKALMGFCLIAGLLVACRKETTFTSNPDSKTDNNMSAASFYRQMTDIWNGINTAYVFWEADTVDWDARRQPMLDWAERMDYIMKNNRFIDSTKEDSTFKTFFQGLIDHHLTVVLYNPYQSEKYNFPYFYAQPGYTEVNERKYEHIEINFFISLMLINQMSSANLIKVSKENGVINYIDTSLNVYSCLINDNIAYLRLNRYRIGDLVSLDTITQHALRSHFRRVKEMYEAGTLKAVILDNRGNRGGYVYDINWAIGLYINEPTTIARYTTKNGPGKYDYTPKQPVTVQPFTQSEYYVGKMKNVYYIALQDIYSISMGEVVSSAIAQMDNGYTIGDRTFGAHGALNAKQFEKHWTGPFGIDDEQHHYVYTSTYLFETWNPQTRQYECQEGKGIEPMIKCVVTDDRENLIGDPQLLRAIQLVNNGY